LHLHTHYSDGADSPETVAARAAEFGASAIAITDHDTLAALPEAAEACAQHAIEFLPGVEISSRAGSKELHILGLGVSPTDAKLTATLARMAAARAERAQRMVRRLVELGVPVSWEDIAARAGGTVGRMHIAQTIVAAGHARTIQDAFDKYIKAGRPAYVPRETLSPREAIDAIHAAGGLAFVAHPGVGDLESRLDALLTEGFDGIEVFHSKHAPHHQQRFAALAAERGLMVSGGSDCHGNVKGDGLLMGRVRVPYTVFEAIRARCAGDRRGHG
jgi:predicted metal-dependent phosphoesterase TrpH